MGLAVLPSRLAVQLEAVADSIINGNDMAENKKISAHMQWAEEVMRNYPDINKSNVDEILKSEVGKVFVKVLEHAGVFKRTSDGKASFDKFIRSI